jgi:hypothetical protein
MIATANHPEINLQQTRTAKTDCVLHNAVMQNFERSGYRALTDVQCEITDGRVALSGVVPSFFLKQIAQTIILRMGRFNGVSNHLEVRSQVEPQQEADHGEFELRVAG